MKDVPSVMTHLPFAGWMSHWWRLEEARRAALLVGAVGAEEVSPFGHEAFVGQVEGASFAVEAVFVPGASLVVHHVHAFTETWSQRREGWKEARLPLVLP